MSQRVTPPMSPFEPIVQPAAGLHDPDKSRTYLFGQFVPPGAERMTPVSIGRSKHCRIQLRNKFVSRFHAIVEQKGEGAYYLRPDQATNGVYVNDEPVFEPIWLLFGMRIQLGRALLYTCNADGRFPVCGLTMDEFLRNSGDMYGSNRLAGDRIDKSHSTVGRARMPPHLRSRKRRGKRRTPKST